MADIEDIKEPYFHRNAPWAKVVFGGIGATSVENFLIFLVFVVILGAAFCGVCVCVYYVRKQQKPLLQIVKDCFRGRPGRTSSSSPKPSPSLFTRSHAIVVVNIHEDGKIEESVASQEEEWRMNVDANAAKGTTSTTTTATSTTIAKPSSQVAPPTTPVPNGEPNVDTKSPLDAVVIDVPLDADDADIAAADDTKLTTDNADYHAQRRRSSVIGDRKRQMWISASRNQTPLDGEMAEEEAEGGNSGDGDSTCPGDAEKQISPSSTTVTSLFRLKRAISYNDTDLKREKQSGEMEGLLEETKSQRDSESSMYGTEQT